MPYSTRWLLTLALLSISCAENSTGSDDIPDASHDERPRDGGAQLPDVASPPAPTSCTEQTDCRDDEYCGADGICVARCDDGGVCMVHVGERYVWSLVAEGPTLYASFAPSQDRFGNSVSDAELYTAVGEGPLTLLARDPIAYQGLELVGEYLYWRAAPDVTKPQTLVLRRMPKAGGGVPETIYPEVHADAFLLGKDGSLAVRKPDGLYVGSSDGKTELRKVVDAAECAAPGAGGTWGCGPHAVSHDRLYYESESAFQLISLDLRTLERREHGHGTDYVGFVDLSPPYLYVPVGSPFYGVARRDLSDPMRPEFIVYRGTSSFSLSKLLYRGAWLYVLGSERTSANYNIPIVVLERSATLGPAQLQTIMPTTFRGRPSETWGVDNLAVSDTHAFFSMWQNSVQRDGGLVMIYRVPLPAAP